MMKMQPPNQAAPAPAVSLESIRKGDIRKAFHQPFVTRGYLGRKQRSKWLKCVPLPIEVPRVQQAKFADIIGRSTNHPTLTTFVKHGAWYSVDVAFTEVMGSDEGIYGKGGRDTSCNKDLGIDPSANLTVKFKPSNNTLSLTSFV
jgi:hypothetical protein